MKKAVSITLLGIILLSGCGKEKILMNNTSLTSVYQGKAIEGISNTAWTFKTEQETELSQPLVTPDSTYFGTSKTLYAIDTKSGTKRWTHAINGRPSVPTLAGNRLIYNDNDGIRAIMAENGEEVWKYDFNQEVPPELKPKATIASSSRTFIVEQSKDGRTPLKAIDNKTGKVSWEYGDTVRFDGFVLAADKLYVPIQNVIHIIDEKNGKKIDSITVDALISSLNVAGDRLYVVDASGQITAFDLKSKNQQWQYGNDAFQMPNAPVLSVLKDMIVATEVRSGLMVGIDAKSGKEMWTTKVGNEKYRAITVWTTTQPSVLEDTLYIGAWNGESAKAKGFPAYSDLIAIDSNSGKEIWRQRIDNFIMYPPAFADGKTIITNMYESVTAYYEGKAPQPAATIEPKPSSTASASNKPLSDNESPKDKVYELKDFEGYWKSDKQAFKIAFTDSDNGVFTIYDQGKEKAVPFEYKKSSEGYNQVMLVVGSEKRPIIISMHDKNTLGYADEKMRDSLRRQDEIQKSSDPAMALISGFVGKWCDSFQALCFELKLTDVKKGTLDYYQERDPFMETFEITYMDEYSIDIKIEGSKLASLSLSKDKKSLKYESRTTIATMTRQK